MPPNLAVLLAKPEFFADPVFPPDSYREWLLRGMLARLGDDGKTARIVHVARESAVIRGESWLAVAFDLDERLRPGRSGYRAFADYLAFGQIEGAPEGDALCGAPSEAGIARLQVGRPNAQPEIVGYELCDLRDVGWAARKWSVAGA